MDYYLFDKRIFRSLKFNKQPLVNLAKDIFKRVMEEVLSSGCDIEIDKVVKIRGTLPVDEQIVVADEIEKVLHNKKIGVPSWSPKIDKALKKYRDAKKAQQGEYAVQQADEVSEPEQEKGS